jgi:hypothetical protein
LLDDIEYVFEAHSLSDDNSSTESVLIDCAENDSAETIVTETGSFQKLFAGREAEIPDSYFEPERDLASERVSHSVNSSLYFPHDLIEEDSDFYDIDHLCAVNQREAFDDTEHGPETFSGSSDGHSSSSVLLMMTRRPHSYNRGQCRTR